jgi:hypothetical protein
MSKINQKETSMFELNNEADVNGTSLAEVLNQPLQDVIETFEAGEGWSCEEEKGYDSHSWTFTEKENPEVVMNCYRRWGTMRVATHAHFRHRVMDFLVFIVDHGEETELLDVQYHAQVNDRLLKECREDLVALQPHMSFKGGSDE